MDHHLEFIIPDPGNIWKFDFFAFPHILETLEIQIFYFLPSWKDWKLKSPTFFIVLEIFEIEV